MKRQVRRTMSRQGVRVWVLVAVVLILGGSTATVGEGAEETAFAPPQFVLSDLGKVGSDIMGFTAFNHRGQAVGLTWGFHAFSWTRDGGTIDLGTLGGKTSEPIAVSDNGLVVGRADTSSGASHAFAWRRGTGMVDIGPLDRSSGGLAVTGSDQVFGLGPRPFQWSPAGGVINLAGLPGSGVRVNAVSETGRIVGSFATEAGESHPFTWTAADGFLDLGTAGYPSGRALLVSDNGRVFGLLDREDRAPLVFLWSKEGGMTVYSWFDGQPLFMNDSGLVVGRGSGLVTWTPEGGFIRRGLSPGSMRVDPIALNSGGRVVGVASDGNGGSYRAFAWTEEGGMVALGSLGNYGQSGAHAVADDGTVYGWSEEAWPGSGLHVVMWSPSATDTTPPTASPVQTPAPNAAGWNSSDVTVTWRWADNSRGSGIDPATCEPVSTTSSEGVLVLVTTCNDVAGNTGSASYTVKIDKTAPTVRVPVNIVVNATGPSGAKVAYAAATATDNLDPNPTLNCTPLSNSVFAIGTTTVNCTATDVAGNSASKQFTVRVKGAADQLTDLLGAVTGVGSGSSLADKVKQIQGEVAASDKPDAGGSLNAFINEVKAQTGKKLNATQAASFIAQATNIKAVLG